MTEGLFTGILYLNLINPNEYYSNLNSMHLSISGLNFIIYDNILDKHRTIPYVLYYHICYLKIMTEHGNCLYSAVTGILSYPLCYELKT